MFKKQNISIGRVDFFKDEQIPVTINGNSSHSGMTGKIIYLQSISGSPISEDTTVIVRSDKGRNFSVRLVAVQDHKKIAKKLQSFID